MSKKEKHPHIENASEDQLAGLLQDKDPVMRELYLATHRLVLQTLSDVMYSTDCKDGTTGYGIRQYGYDGWGMAALTAYTRWVSLTFLHGADLEDRSGILEGTKWMRHLRLRSFDQFEQLKIDLRILIEKGAILHRS